MLSNIKSIVNEDVSNKVVILRADLNIPLVNGVVQDQTRLKRLMPTINYLLENQSKLVICSHLGRPKGKFDENFSLKPLANVLSEITKAKVHFNSSCIGKEVLKQKKDLEQGEILLLENLRFHESEIKNDNNFANELSKGCDFFVNDAFSCSHRAHASLHAITNFLPSFSGLLLDEEVKALTSVLNSPIKPVAALVGGAKISSKINIIEYLLTKMDYLVIGGAMANTFLIAQGLNMGKSLYEKDCIDIAKSILKTSELNNCQIILPIDLVVSEKFETNANFEIVSSNAVPSEMMALDIGPKTIRKINSVFQNINTLLWNGPVGAFETPPFGKGTFSLAKEAAKLTANENLITVAGGGDTMSALNKACVVNDFTYVSSAGGAFLEWLEGMELPAISVLNNNLNNKFRKEK